MFFIELNFQDLRNKNADLLNVIEKVENHDPSLGVDGNIAGVEGLLAEKGSHLSNSTHLDDIVQEEVT